MDQDIEMTQIDPFMDVSETADTQTAFPPGFEDPTLQGNQDRKPSPEYPWFVHLLIRAHLISGIDNQNSAARDHLANERTVLAWTRTSLNFVTVGVGIVQLYNMSLTTDDEHFLRKMEFARKYGKPMGTCFLALSLLSAIIGLFRYFMVQHLLRKDEFPVSRLSVMIIMISTFALAVTVLVSVLKFQLER